MYTYLRINIEEEDHIRARQTSIWGLTPVQIKTYTWHEEGMNSTSLKTNFRQFDKLGRDSSQG